MARKRRSYSLEFKQEAVRLVEQEGMSYAAVGRDLGINKSTIRDWCEKAKAGELTGSLAKPKPSPERALEEENRQLRREIRILREDRGILKKATAFFARETE